LLHPQILSLEAVLFKGGRSVIATGHAWHYGRYDHTAALEAAERNARAARRGLWADAEPVPPWEWRKSEKRR
jgi:endonuclease YncB( thermonuclease family)